MAKDIFNCDEFNELENMESINKKYYGFNDKFDIGK
jgi:hypothetical protein